MVVVGAEEIKIGWVEKGRPSPPGLQPARTHPHSTTSSPTPGPGPPSAGRCDAMRCSCEPPHPTLPYSDLAAQTTRQGSPIPLEGARAHVLVLQQDMSIRM